MSLLWMDGFDHYGGDAGKMRDGVYASVGGAVTLSSTRARTGAYSCKDSGSTAGNGVRRIFGAAKVTVGVGFAVWLDDIPANANYYGVAVLCDTDNVAQLELVLQPTGKLELFRANAGSPVSLGVTADGAVVAGAFQHVEFRARAGNSDGAFELRVNGATVLSLSSVDTVATSHIEFSQVRLIEGVNTGNTALPSSGRTYVDDLFAWDDAGSRNNDFLGDRRVRTFFPNADTAVADWTPNGAASGWDCINEAAPDDDSTYIEAAALSGPALVSEFDIESMPATIGAVAAVQTVARMKKQEAGVANAQISMLSAAAAHAGTDRPLTTAYTYYGDVHELDPNTGTAWTESSLNAAKIRVSRTA